MAETKPTRAVALHYARERDGAPRVVASGKGDLAARILATARDAGVPVTSDPDLLEILAKVPIGQEIPAELYQAVAEILVFVYRINGRYSCQVPNEDG